MQTMIGMIYFLSKFRVNLCEKSPEKIKFETSTELLSNQNGIWLNIQARDS